jgi:ketosteroid isomerase-like protein
MHAPPITLADVSAIKATSAVWTRTCLERDWEALLAVCTDDVVFLPPDEPLVPTDKVRAWLEAYPVMRRFEVEFDHIEGQDQLAAAYGRFSLTAEVQGRLVDVDGKFLDALRRDAHGRWQYAVVAWNANAPVVTS